MNLEYDNIRNSKNNHVIAVTCGIIKRLFQIEEKPFFSNKMDEESNGHAVKKQLRCRISSCFDKNNICCKECDIKKCRYKCNFIDSEVCEHQFI